MEANIDKTDLRVNEIVSRRYCPSLAVNGRTQDRFVFPLLPQAMILQITISSADDHLNSRLNSENVQVKTTNAPVKKGAAA